MHIGMIHLLGGSSFPPDIRIEKEAKALSQNRHQVTVLAKRRYQNELTYEELGPNYTVHRIKAINSLISKVKFRITLIAPEYFTPISNFIEKYQPDILHVHDFTFLPTTLIVAKKFNIPVVADLHENMPAALVAGRNALPVWKQIASFFVHNYYLWRWHEKRYLTQCAKIIVVVPEAAERLDLYGIPERKIVIVSNTEDETTFQTNIDQCDTEIFSKYDSDWMISYVGGIGPHRGLDTSLKALPLIRSSIPNFKLVIVGARGQQQQMIEQEAQMLGISDLIDIIGWQPFNKVNSYMLASKVGIVPHNNFEHTQTTVPHKLFQYMICAKPVLVSDCRPLARIVKETGAGYVFTANDPEDLAKKLIEIYNHPQEALQKGKNGKKAALGSYAWRNDANQLLMMYTKLEKSIQGK